ncbi:MAG: hypothetical protein AM325_013895 [Candidatus Thorarchaeota archaeon SMTZ1-45]|nr:MAG: hypothetical protein AM325_15415 [Candidatus Thorarchaeota archaeon SMTZ1-45]
MSGNLSRKRKHKVMRQRSKDEIRWYTKFFADIIQDRYERTMFLDSEYIAPTSEEIQQMIQNQNIRRKENFGRFNS